MTVTVPVSRLGVLCGWRRCPNRRFPERARRRSYSAKYKAAILAEYEGWTATAGVR